VLQGHWTERVIAGPVFTLQATAGAYTSRNSLEGAPYFNPRRDFSPSLELAGEWVQSRRYERAFRHRLVADAGTYQQEGFGSGQVLGLRYEQDWQLDMRRAVRYGVGRTLHPYDGAQTSRNYAFFGLDWTF